MFSFSRFSVTGSSVRPLTSGVRVSNGPQSATASRSFSLAAPVIDAANSGAAKGPDRISASLGPSFDGANVQIANTGGISWNRYLTGLVPEDDQGLIPYYRDCYSFDSVAGATVDMQCSFTFSDFTLVGKNDSDTTPFQKSCDSINVRSLMQETALNYLVDGSFVGTFVYDDKNNIFRDVMIHDRLNCHIVDGPFFNAEPAIRVDASQQMARYMSSSSQFVKEVLSRYPRNVLETFARGGVDLDPITTVYIPRKAAKDQQSTSYLRRILPAYLLEKTLFRGTLIEAQRRMRATSLVNMGTDTWEPTPEELMGMLTNFRAAEADPLGGWIITRQGVNVQDIRPAGDFWKWTDLIDTLVPYKLRALGVSEAFLSGEAAYATAEVAMTVFTENSAALRNLITRKFFYEKLFPLIAVTNKLYVDPGKAIRGNSVASLLANLSAYENLNMPEIRWNKQLDHTDPQLFEMLEKLSEKGIPVPLKMWAAATNVSLEALLGDLKGDEELKSRIKAITGKDVDVSVGAEDTGGMGEFGSFRTAPIRTSRVLNAASRRQPLLMREFIYPDGTPMDAPIRVSKSGKVVHAVYNEAAARRRTNESIFHAARSLSDPSRRAAVRQSIVQRAGGVPNIL